MTQKALPFVPQYTKINSQASKSQHPQGKQVCCLAVRKLISLRTCTRAHTHTPEIYSCQGANLNSEPIMFLQLAEHNKGNCSYCKHRHQLVCFQEKKKRTACNKFKSVWWQNIMDILFVRKLFAYLRQFRFQLIRQYKNISLLLI